MEKLELEKTVFSLVKSGFCTSREIAMILNLKKKIIDRIYNENAWIIESIINSERQKEIDRLQNY
jgi:hypothetical protein